MTDQPLSGGPNQPPPPPEGMSYPPPPPSAGGFAPPPPGPVVRAQPTESYTPWLTRGLAGLLIRGYALWNFGYRQGTTGSSIGKGIMKFKVVSEATGQPLGFAMSV